MKRTVRSGSPTGRLTALAFAVALTGCDAGVEFNPTGPTYSPFTALGTERSVEIAGSLTAEDGACFEATVLYDGRELPGARVACTAAHGCERLDLSGIVRSAEGHHTLSFRVLRQSRQTVEYTAEATLRVRRDGATHTVTLALEKSRARIRGGESVRFDVHFSNSLW